MCGCFSVACVLTNVTHGGKEHASYSKQGLVLQICLQLLSPGESTTEFLGDSRSPGFPWSTPSTVSGGRRNEQ